MKLKLTGGDGDELILAGNNPVEFGFDLANQLEYNDISELIDISEDLWAAYKYVTELHTIGYNLSDIIYRHQNPMNPGKNFELTIVSA